MPNVKCQNPTAMRLAFLVIASDPGLDPGERGIPHD